MPSQRNKHSLDKANRLCYRVVLYNKSSPSALRHLAFLSQLRNTNGTPLSFLWGRLRDTEFCSKKNRERLADAWICSVSLRSIEMTSISQDVPFVKFPIFCFMYSVAFE